MQEAMNHRNEIDRLRSDIAHHRIPALREPMFRQRLHVLEKRMEYLDPIISKHGDYHHVYVR